MGVDVDAKEKRNPLDKNGKPKKNKQKVKNYKHNGGHRT